MSRLRSPWVLYVLFLALGLGAMGWITHQALKAERAEQRAQRETRMEERSRLALWRLDSTMALFLAPETARPWHHFETFHRDGGKAVPSPMLALDDPMVLLRFQIDAAGGFSSPLVPDQDWASLASKAVTDPLRLEVADSRLRAVQQFLSLGATREAMRRGGAVLFTREQMEELRARSRRGSSALASPYEVNQGVWVPFWIGGDLFMARQVWVGERELFQITWLEWAAVKEVLMSAIRDLLPAAELEPALEPVAKEKERRMGSLPLRLIPGVMPDAPAAGRTAARTALILGWAFALVGALAGGFVLSHALELSERRGAFASAVTHELRTPLTTFRLYTELLAKDMVDDPEERRTLLITLLEEADRLDHLVKNVLAYARLEARRETALESITLVDLLERPLARLKDRAGQGGLLLEVSIPPGMETLLLRTDALLVEQILANLVDNAAKYAAGARDPRLHLEVLEGNGALRIRVRDHGDGIDPADRRHLFRPFHKSAQKAARTAPGVGLGLALCRKLARNLGGDLELDLGVTEGAAFLLSLPL